MPVTVAASLVGAFTPRHVQVEVEGLTVSDVVSIRGTLGIYSWPVRGATDVAATSTQMLATDVFAPLNAPIVYEVTVNDVVYVADPVTVPHDTDYAVTSLDGSVSASLAWVDNDFPTKIRVNQHFTEVEGRATPVVRWSRAGGRSGVWELETETTEETLALEALLAPGAPLVVRTSGGLRDLPPSILVALSDPEHELVGKIGELRAWQVKWTQVGDPLLLTRASGWLLGDMNAVVAELGGTLGDLNDFVVSLGGTLADVNRFDWASEAAP